jgi:hypothetical protein
MPLFLFVPDDFRFNEVREQGKHAGLDIDINIPLSNSTSNNSSLFHSVHMAILFLHVTGNNRFLSVVLTFFLFFLFSYVKAV